MIRPYVPSDYETYRAWHIKHGEGWDLPSYLPPIGIVADEMAMGWLVKTDIPCAIVENLVTDPDAPLLARGKAAKKIVEELLRIAGETGFKSVMFFTSKSSVMNVGEALGAKALDFNMYEKRL